MSRGRTLLLLTAAPGEADRASVEEFLRVAVGLAAGGHALEAIAMHDLGPLSATARTYVEALAKEGLPLVPAAPDGAALRRALGRADRILRLAAAGRAAAPTLLLIDSDYLRAIGETQLRADLRSAGQVARVPSVQKRIDPVKREA